MSISKIEADANAQATVIKNEAKAEVIERTINFEAEAYAEAGVDVGLAGDDLLAYIYFLNLYELKNTKLLIGVDNTIVSMGGSNPLSSKTDL